MEKGENGTEHWQGYLELKRSLVFNSVKKFFLPLKPHLEKRMGTPLQARAYCMKEESRIKGPWEVGFFKEPEQGKRNDLLDMLGEVDSGSKNSEVYAKHPVAYARYYKAVQHVRSLILPPKMRDLEVIMHYGPPGVGKTHDIINDHDDLFIKPMGKNLWFDGYTDQQYLLLDDFSVQCTLTELLRLLDKYRLQVEIKGGHAWMHATKIFITTNIHPRDWYDFSNREEQYDALARRFHKIYYYSEYNTRRRITPKSFFDSHGAFHLFEDETLESTSILEEPTEEDSDIIEHYLVEALAPSAPRIVTGKQRMI